MPGDRFLRRVRQAASSVLGDSATGRQVVELCDEHDEARRMILQDRSSGATVLAVVGATGQGKSWLIRQLVQNPTVAASIQSGNNLNQATEKLIWIGPRPPADLDPRHERFIHCESGSMKSIGVPYLIVDAPGATDDRRNIAQVAARALSLASVLVLVVRRDQLRADTASVIAMASEGTIVVPVINAIRTRDKVLLSDADAFVAQLRNAAPLSNIVNPVLVDDFEVDGRSESSVGEASANRLAEVLVAELGNAWEGDRRKSTRLAALDERFRAALQSVLGDELPGLTHAVSRLNAEAKKLPGEVAETLVGGKGPLRAAVRTSLRSALLTQTGGIWFPYRSQLGLLNLTHGAWDRVFLSLSGSLPSLVSAVWSSTKTLTADRNADDDMRDGLKKRSTAAVADRLGPLAGRFREELAALRNQSAASERLRTETDESRLAYLAGLDSLQERSQQIFDEETERVSISQMPSTICALFGTAIFWTLMAGPIFSLYHEYLHASYQSLTGDGISLERFPKPEFSLILTSLIVSILPTAIFAMIVLSTAQSSRRVRSAEQKIRQRHHDTIEKLQRDGILQLRWDDPLLSDAEFLVSAGGPPDSESQSTSPQLANKRLATSR